MDERDLDPDPLRQFERWFAAAGGAGIQAPESMTLATATPDGRPSARMVLLKGADERGFAFYTNLESRKGRELRENPHAALLFHWQALGRQVRVEGPVERVPDDEAEAYFRTRPLASRLAAWASAGFVVVAPTFPAPTTVILLSMCGDRLWRNQQDGRHCARRTMER